MQEQILISNAQNIRSVIKYIQQFKNAIIVIYIDDEIIYSPFFSSHIRDISLLHQAGIKVAIVPGCRKRIDQILSNAKIQWKYENDIRITCEEAIPLIKMAAFDTSNIVMTSLAANQITATIGNWVRARAKGIIDGIDFGTAGEIDKLQTDSIKNILENGFIPIFPCIGWSSTGKPYNISSIILAQEIAISLKADKLFFLMHNEEISSKKFSIPKEIGLSQEEKVPAMNLEEVEKFLELNSNNEDKKILKLLKTSVKVCKNGVSRVHLINGTFDGAIPCEIFSELGFGTMIYSSNYENIRSMVQQDIPSVFSLMRPFVKEKILLPRTEEELSENLDDYIVYEIDNNVRACAAIHFYKNEKQAEIYAVAVDESFSKLGIGPKLIQFLINKAQKNNFFNIFLLTTRTSDWFEKLGFKPDSIDSIPQKRKSIWTVKRNSKVLRLLIKNN